MKTPEHPAQSAAQLAASVMDQSLALVRRLADSNRSQFEELKHAAQQLVARQDEIQPRFASERGQSRERARSVDAWIVDIFSATERAIPRETLLDEFIARYRRERRVTDSERHAGPWLFVFASEHAQGRRVAIHPHASAGVHPLAFARLCAEHLPQAADDPFLGPLFGEEHDIEGWHAAWFGGSPLFDRLVDARRRFAGEADYWVNGVRLPGDGRDETLAVFLLHANAGDLLHPEPPPSMRQDQRLLLVLLIAWRALEHQLKSLVRISEANRRDLIQLIAPGLLHHEIGALMKTLDAQSSEQARLLTDLVARVQAPPGSALQLAGDYAHTITGLAARLHAITDAFNHLDKRGQIESTDLGRIFAELRLLLTHRLGAVGVDLAVDDAVFAATRLRTDVVLFEQALLNLLNNALNALDESDTPPPRRIRAYLEKSDAGQLTLALVNNGPPIPAHLDKDIFRRGFTTREHGHGQGLYLARLVAHYLGGELHLIETQALPAGFHAGFRLRVNDDFSAREGLHRAND